MDVNTIISLISLGVAIFAAWYTLASNRGSIYISNYGIENVLGEKLIYFNVTNTSPKPLVISQILLMSDGNQIYDNGFDPYERHSEIRAAKSAARKKNNSYVFDTRSFLPDIDIPSYSVSDNHTNATLLIPNETINFSYYVDSLPTNIIFKSNKRIGWISKKKSVVPTFVDDPNI